MVFIKRLAFLFFLSVLAISCQDDLDDVPATGQDINNFIYRGMNAYYLYKPEIPVLADDRFANFDKLNPFIPDLLQNNGLKP